MIETFTISAKILRLDILSELKVHPLDTRYDIYLNTTLISTIEYISDRPEQWYQIKGTLSRADVAEIGVAIKSHIS